MDLRQRAREELAAQIDVEGARYLEREVFNTCLDRAAFLHVNATWEDKAFRSLFTQRIMSVKHALGNWRSAFENDPRQAAKDLTNADAKTRDPTLWAETEVEDHEGFERCRKCKSTRTNYRALQTRSGDEPMTLFFSCKDCGARWKM